MFRTVEWNEGVVRLIDQTKLPLEEVYVDCLDYKSVADAIRNMVVRGAPAIGVTAALGITLGIGQIKTDNFDEFWHEMEIICEVFAKTRPTAVNLFWAIKRMKQIALENKEKEVGLLKKILEEEAVKIARDDVENNKLIGRFGKELIKDGSTILTHCNAGALATAGYGTALGVIRAAYEEGKKIKVFVDETRPLLQGARLTAWELNKDGIPVTLITDNMAGYFMKKGMIDLVVVGADRIARNGDTANKIGTYSVAVLAKEHQIPFYVAAPISTLDISIPSGEHIPIEGRNSTEVTSIGGKKITVSGIEVLNPAFDITPHKFITAIITERGIIKAPFSHNVMEGLS